MAVPLQESGQADFSLPAIAVGMQVHLLMLEGSQQPLHQDVVVAALPSRPADFDLLCMQPGHEVTRGELIALVGVEDFGLAATFQCHFQGIKIELRVIAVGELPVEDISVLTSKEHRALGGRVPSNGGNSLRPQLRRSRG